jgi:hypothetical protein
MGIRNLVRVGCCMKKPEFSVDVFGTKQWILNEKWHREDGPAIEYPNGNKYWFLNNEEVHPETIVDLWLSRGVFCWYDENNDCLDFGEKNEQT